MQSSLRALGLVLGLGAAQQAAAVPSIEHWQTDSGARVYFVAARDLPIVDIQIMFDAGSARDGARFGLGAFTLHMLEQGADGLSADQISQEFDRVGARYETEINQDYAAVRLRSLTDPDKLRPALETLRRVIAAADFPEDALRREQQRMLIGIRAKQQSPGALASDAFYAAAYGDHPYAHPVEGTEPTVSALSRQDLVEFHRRHYTARNASVAVVGDLDLDGARSLVAELLRTLPAGEPLPPLPDVAPLPGPRETRIEFPATQTHILTGVPVLTRNDPDYFPLYVGNHVLGGGGMVSRLFASIREQRGLSYSVYSYFDPLRRPGPFVAGLQTSNEQAEEALKLLREEIRSFVEHGPDERELAASKQNITGGFPLRLNSNANIVKYLAVIGFYELPLDYLENFTRRVEAVTVDQVRDAFRRRIKPGDFATVLVGQ